jgi:hypothetical protein
MVWLIKIKSNGYPWNNKFNSSDSTNKKEMENTTLYICFISTIHNLINKEVWDDKF